MAKVTIPTISSGFASTTQLNTALDTIETQFNSKVLYRDNPTGESNQMEQDLDMNDNTLYNVRDAVSVDEVVTLGQMQNYIAASSSGLIATTSEKQTAEQDQTLFTFTGITYVPGVNNIAVFVNGSRQQVGVDYAETSSTSITFTGSLNEGDIVDCYTNEALTSTTLPASAVSYQPAGTGAVATTVQSKLREFVSVKDFGAVGDGVTDDTAAIQAALNSGAQKVNGVPGAVYKITSTLSWNAGQCDFDGNACTLDFSGSTGLIHAFVFSDAVSTARRKKISNVIIKGPLAASNMDGFYLNSAVINAVTNVAFEQVTILNFKYKLRFGNQCSNVFFYNCNFTDEDGAAFKTSTCIYIQSSPVNSGEQFSFTQCQFNNVDKILVCDGGLSGGVNFTQCSLVYFNMCVELNSPARVSISQCSIEGDAHINNWFVAIGNGANIRIADSDFWFAAAVTKEIFFSATSAVYGGIFLERCFLSAPSGFGGSLHYLVDQSNLGNFYASDFRSYDGQIRKPFGKNPGVQVEPWSASSANFANGWIADSGNGSAVGVTSAEQYNGDTTVISTNAAGQEIKRYRRYAVKGGQIVVASLFMKTSGFGTDSTVFQISARAYDASNNLISSGTLYTSSGDLTNFTEISLNWTPVFPAGTSHLEYYIYGQPQALAGTRSIFLADMVVNPV